MRGHIIDDRWGVTYLDGDALGGGGRLTGHNPDLIRFIM